MLADLAVQPSPQSQKEAMVPKKVGLGDRDTPSEIVSFGARLGQAMGSDKGLARGEVAQGKEKTKVTDDSTEHQKDKEARQTKLRSSNSLTYFEQVLSLSPVGQLVSMVDSGTNLGGKPRQGEDPLETTSVLETLETQETKPEQMDIVRTWFNGATEEVSGEVKYLLDTGFPLAQGDAISLSEPLVDLELAVSQAMLTPETRIGWDKVLRGILATGDGDVVMTYPQERLINDVTGLGDPMADSATSSVLEQDDPLAFLQKGHRTLQTEIGGGTIYNPNSRNWLGTSALLRTKVGSASTDSLMGKTGTPRLSSIHANGPRLDLIDLAGSTADDVDLLSTLLEQDALREDSVAFALDGQIGDIGFEAHEGLSLNEVLVEEHLFVNEALTEAMALESPLPWNGTAMSQLASSQYGPEGGLGNLTLEVAANDLASLHRDDLEPGSQDGTSGEVALGTVREYPAVEPMVDHFSVTTEELAVSLKQQGSLEEVAGIYVKNEKPKPTENNSEINQSLSSPSYRQMPVSITPKGEQDTTQGEAYAFEDGSNMVEPSEVESGHGAAEPTQLKAVELEQSEGTPERAKDSTINNKEVTRPETLLATSIEQSPVVDKAGSLRPSPSAPVNVRQVVDQIVHKVELEMKGEYGEIRLQLKPENLGELEIKIATDNGVVSAAFLAESKTVKGLIEAGLPQLKQQLMQQGLNIQDVSVEVGGGNSHGGQSYTGSADANLSGDWYHGGSGTDTVGATARTGQSLWGSTIDYRA